MMGLTDRVGPWARRFQRADATAAAPAQEAEPAPRRASLRARRDDAAEPPEHRTSRFARRVLAEQER
jgi:hypothetical protein